MGADRESIDKGVPTIYSLVEQTPSAFVELVKPFVEKLKRDDDTVNGNFERIREAIDKQQAHHDNGVAELEALKQVVENLSQDFNRWYDRLAERMDGLREHVVGDAFKKIERVEGLLADTKERVAKQAEGLDDLYKANDMSADEWQTLKGRVDALASEGQS